jgi:integrase
MRANERGWWDIAQVCTNGHLVNQRVIEERDHCQPFCDRCGSATVMACRRCCAPIRGEYHAPNGYALGPIEVPGYCLGCGAAYPWTERRIQAAKELADEVEHVPYIGRRRLSALEPEHVQSAYAVMLNDLSPRSVYTTHGTLRQALQKAVQWDRIPRNPTDHVDPPSVENPEMQTLSEQEFVRLLTTSVGDDWHPLWVLLGTTGMRLGEALALKWQYVGDDTVRIVRTIRAERGRGLVSVKPKTKNSNRTLELTMQGIRALKKQKASQAERRLGAGPLWQNDDFVFTNDDGSAIHRERVARAFKRALKQADVRPIRIHDLRHTFATLQLEQGVNVKKISEMLGHSNVGITLGIYSHVTKQMDREAVDRMEEMLSSAGF